MAEGSRQNVSEKTVPSTRCITVRWPRNEAFDEINPPHVLSYICIICYSNNSDFLILLFAVAGGQLLRHKQYALLLGRLICHSNVSGFFYIPQLMKMDRLCAYVLFSIHCEKNDCHIRLRPGVIHIRSPHVSREGAPSIISL